MSRWPLTHKENVSCINRQCKVNPVHVVISFKQSSVLKSHILLALSQKISYEWIEHLLRSYMSYKATFSLSQRWPLNTGFTLRILSENIRKNIRALPGRKARLWRGFSPVSQRLQINYIFFWQCTYIVFILQCKKYPKQLANFLKREKNKKDFWWCPLWSPRLYTVTVSYGRSTRIRYQKKTLFLTLLCMRDSKSPFSTLISDCCFSHHVTLQTGNTLFFFYCEACTEAIVSLNYKVSRWVENFVDGNENQNTRRKNS